MEGFIYHCNCRQKTCFYTSRAHKPWWSPRGQSGQASFEVIIVSLALLLIVIVPVTVNEQTLLVWLEFVVMSWMMMYSALWQQFLLHPWAS